MKKIMILTELVLSVLLAGSVGIGTAKSDVGIGLIFGDPSGITLKFGNFPVLAFGLSGSGYGHVNIDYWIINKELSAPIDWYLGVGAKVQSWNWNNSRTGDYLGVGVRFPVGLQWFPAKQWELFVEAAPGLRVIPLSGWFWWDAGFGVRYHL